MPALFVLLWSTGFIGAKLGLGAAEPATFLLVRFVIVIALMLAVAVWAGARWPATWRETGHAAVAGLLVHATYLGGVFAAIDHGLPAGISALIVGLQPLLTAIAVGPVFGERITPRQWAGFMLGFGGVALVCLREVSFAAGDWTGIVLSLVALLGITAGTLYQKRFCAGMDLRSGAVIQFVAAAFAMLALAAAFETMRIDWTGEFIFALAWLVLVLSLGAITLLYLLIRRGRAANVASMFYLVPPLTALLGYLLFGETLGALAILGMAVAATGVALVNRP